MQQDLCRMMRVNIVRNPVHNPGFLFGIGSKNMIIDHQYTTQIFIDVLQVAAMVHPMVGWCVEQPI